MNRVEIGVIERVRSRVTAGENEFLSIRSPGCAEDAQLLLRIGMRPEFAIVCAVSIDKPNLSAAANVSDCAGARPRVFLRQRQRHAEDNHQASDAQVNELGFYGSWQRVSSTV